MPRFPLTVDPARSRAAGLRLGAARRRFDLSTIALRRAALDHVDGEALVSAALRAALERVALPPGPGL
ncbi:hypothetical protein FV218_18530 [Methylobacterium sp. WL69]|uniref:hypothetical protein n=1 Tax=Methylobacterium sp. WL69 TaxID=2603893 RepID=UPI0011CB1AF5|nr:hypothetical protein [Methylobacterium sp. WL69]TXM68226.1 hypothetical protein FV218_18530 [Methylobacterium sp. WL69]